MKKIKINKNTNKGIPKRDGSGKGRSANAGRGGCINPKRSK